MDQLTQSEVVLVFTMATTVTLALSLGWYAITLTNNKDNK